MSVIQQIQDKYAKLMAIIIAVALMIFVVMLALKMEVAFWRRYDHPGQGEWRAH